jgi:ABC-2 type transport system permease protein
MAFVATFPVQVLLGKAGFELVFVGLATAVIFLFLASRFWNFALRHYSSASS